MSSSQIIPQKEKQLSLRMWSQRKFAIFSQVPSIYTKDCKTSSQTVQQCICCNQLISNPNVDCLFFPCCTLEIAICGKWAKSTKCTANHHLSSNSMGTKCWTWVGIPGTSLSKNVLITIFKQLCSRRMRPLFAGCIQNLYQAWSRIFTEGSN